MSAAAVFCKPFIQAEFAVRVYGFGVWGLRVKWWALGFAVRVYGWV